MRYAIVSDIHANLQAWNAVIVDMAELNVDHIICLGDLVGYGPNPVEILAAVREHASVTVLGNHDAAACRRMDASVFNENAREAINWTMEQLPDGDMDFLNDLPLIVRPEGTELLVVHAEAIDPMGFGYILSPDDAAANFSACADRLILIGHTHQAGVFMMQPSGAVSVHPPIDFSCSPGNRYIINPGSVGDPRSPEIVASYAIYDSESEAVTFRKVVFDVEAYRQSIEATSIAARPFFLRHLDHATSSFASKQLVIPSVAESDSVSGFQLTTLDVKIKKKDPIVRVGIGVLMLALVTGIWFFISSSMSRDSQGTANNQNEPEDAANPDVSVKSTVPVNKPISIKPIVVAKLPVNARYVRVSIPRNEFLSLAEVEIFSKGKNVARMGKATQSSIHSAIGTADKAIDGNPSPRYDDRHMTHTKAAKGNWWMVDLGKEYAIDSVVLWNRDEGRTKGVRAQLRSRLNGFTLEMLDEGKRCVFLKKNNNGKLRKIIVK